MKKIVSALVASLTAFALLFGISACGGKEPQREIGEDYVIVYASGDMRASGAAGSVAAAVKESLGAELPVRSDSSAAAEKEILVGAVQGREYSDYAARMPKKGGWYVGVFGDDVYIQTDSGSYDDAVRAFASYFLGVPLEDGANVSSSGDYAVDGMTLCGAPAGFYDIVYPFADVAARSAAEDLSAWILENVGYELPVRDENTEGSACELFVGAEYGGTLAADEYAAVFSENSVKIAAESGIVEDAVASFITRFFAAGEGDIVLSASAEAQVCKCWEYLATGLEKVQTLENAQVAEGVSYEKFRMEDGSGNAVTAFMLVAEAGAGWRVRAATHPGYTASERLLSTVQNTAQSLEDEGETVLFACNGGFFRANRGNIPESVLIRDGENLSATGSYGEEGHGFFGVTKSGEIVIGTYEELGRIWQDLQQAVGSRGLLLQDGKLYDICYGASDALGESRHPRTAVGLRENGDLVFVVADGRQAGYSVGLNLCDLAKLMRSLGAADALNLDGGGSSSFVLRENGALTLKNSPSDLDGSGNRVARAVGDCLVLVAA